MSIKFKIILSTLILSALMLFSIVFNIYNSYANKKRTIKNLSEVSVEDTTEKIDLIYENESKKMNQLISNFNFYQAITNIDQRIQNGELFSQNLTHSDKDYTVLKSILESYSLDETITSAYVAFTDNNSIIGSFSDDELPKNFSAKTRPWYLKAYLSRTISIGEFYIDSLSNRFVNTISIPIINGDKIIAIFAVDITLNTLKKSFYKIQGNDISSLTIFDIANINNYINIFSNKTESLNDVRFYKKTIYQIENKIKQNKNMYKNNLRTILDFELYQNGKITLITYSFLSDKNIVVFSRSNYYSISSAQKDNIFFIFEIFILISAIFLLVYFAISIYKTLTCHIFKMNHHLNLILRAEQPIKPLNFLDIKGAEFISLFSNIDKILKNTKNTNLNLEYLSSDINLQKNELKNSTKDLFEFSQEFNIKRFRLKDLEKKFRKGFIKLNQSISASEFHMNSILEISDFYRKKMSYMISFTENVNEKNRDLSYLLDDSINILEKLSLHSEKELNVINGMSLKMQKIEQQSDELKTANFLIAELASKTNILALNAAIEAAHMEDKDHGFSVVANEIRKLAEKSAIQSKKIEEKVALINENISESTNMTYETKDLFDLAIVLIKNIYIHVQNMKLIINEQTIEINISQSRMEEIKTTINSSIERLEKFKNNNQEFSTTTEYVSSIIDKMTNMYLGINNEVNKIYRFSSNIEKTEEELGKSLNLIKENLNYFENNFKQGGL